jgi:hypothetical protein
MVMSFKRKHFLNVNSIIKVFFTFNSVKIFIKKKSKLLLLLLLHVRFIRRDPN